MKPAYPLLFWKVRGRSPEAHFLGSLHALPTNIYPLATHIEAVVDRAEVVMFELADLPYSPAMSQRLKAVEPLERRLAKHPQLLNRLCAKAAKLQIGMAELRYASLLSITNHVIRADFSESDEPTVQGLDDYVRARCQGRATVEYLETRDENIVHLVNLPASAQINRLVEYLSKRTPRQDAEDKEVQMAILAGDIEPLARQIARDHREHPDWLPAESRMRNPGWVRNIQRVLSLGKRTLIVGGAGHFAGEGNVLQLLKKEYGICSEPVRC